MRGGGLLSNLNSSSDHFSLKAYLQSSSSFRLGALKEMGKTHGNLKDKLRVLLWGPVLFL